MNEWMNELVLASKWAKTDKENLSFFKINILNIIALYNKSNNIIKI